MKCEIITTGSELLNGSTMDTNSFYIMGKLYKLGVDVNYNISVPDNDEIMISTFKESVSRSDLIYIVGGLGPTEDDKTKDLVLKAIEEIKESGEDYSISDIDNPLGTALGVYIIFRNKKLFLFPGPPREMEPMFDSTVEFLQGNGLKDFKLKTVNLIGLGESKIEPILKEIKKTTIKDNNIELLTYPKDRRVDVHIKYEDELNKLEVLDEILKKLQERLGSYIYGYDCESIEEVFMNMAKKRDIKLAIAESCTGGLLADKITNIPGASDILMESLVTYTYSSKNKNLNIDLDFLTDKGAVNRETAKMMVGSVYRKNNVDLAISTTGVAGPGPSEGKGEGTVYIGIKTKDCLQVEEYRFKGCRKTIKNLAATQALIDAIKVLKNIK